MHYKLTNIKIDKKINISKIYKAIKGYINSKIMISTIIFG